MLTFRYSSPALLSFGKLRVLLEKPPEPRLHAAVHAAPTVRVLRPPQAAGFFLMAVQALWHWSPFFGKVMNPSRFRLQKVEALQQAEQTWALGV